MKIFKNYINLFIIATWIAACFLVLQFTVLNRKVKEQEKKIEKLHLSLMESMLYFKNVKKEQ